MVNVKPSESSAANKTAIRTICGYNEDGNLDAEVNHRKGLLADLLALTTAGDGEVAVATDYDATVVYNDDGGGNSVGVANFASKKLSTAVVDLSAFQSVAPGAYVPKTFIVNANTYDPNSLIDGATNTLLFPAGLLSLGFSNLKLSFIGSVQSLQGAPAGTEINAVIRTILISTGLPSGSFDLKSSGYVDLVGGIVLPIAHVKPLLPAGFADTLGFQLWITHSHSSNVAFAGTYLEYTIEGY